ncbi:histone-lysine N-methyltransferase ASHH1-like isoform X1 [Chenopodium quinoa]|uniref:histone-lysine N-methyltransferase ASHH1-like isoform X1 n=1 Tax=Chenopodium quinoa TaxID=63459 RepID=UPI000B77BF4F|nr:histone-lysine N-methyltransferase ASHH1-like isoform X1 [Chenopodium quinoa]
MLGRNYENGSFLPGTASHRALAQGQACQEIGYIHIDQNEFSYRKHKKQKEEDIVICECKFNPSDPESACGDGCLNVHTSTECTPGYCPCGVVCKNQKFQKCEYAKTKLFTTNGRGWGLLADEEIKAGQLIIEYCGEVISWKEAKSRAQAYETQGLKDAYIISLNAFESIDATRKGSFARFINHSCHPNCETRKWTVLGEIRVGIFAKHDISVGTELAYDYNFEWYGGAKVRCLCGAASCSGFLGAKSRGFQEDTYLWEDDDDRYSVEKIPLYDSAEDEASMQTVTSTNSSKIEFMMDADHIIDSTLLNIDPLASLPANGLASISRNYPLPKKKLKRVPKGKSKNLAQKEFNAKYVVSLLEAKEAQQEILMYEEMKTDASSNLESLYNEIRPAIEEHERDTQDSVPTSVAEKWIDASCVKLKSEFDLYFSITKNVVCAPKKSRDVRQPGSNMENGVMLLTNQ